MVLVGLAITLVLEMLLLREPQAVFLKVLVAQEVGAVLVTLELARHLEVVVLLVVVMEALVYLVVVVALRLIVLVRLVPALVVTVLF